MTGKGTVLKNASRHNASIAVESFPPLQRTASFLNRALALRKIKTLFLISSSMCLLYIKYYLGVFKSDRCRGFGVNGAENISHSANENSIGFKLPAGVSEPRVGSDQKPLGHLLEKFCPIRVQRPVF